MTESVSRAGLSSLAQAICKNMGVDLSVSKNGKIRRKNNSLPEFTAKTLEKIGMGERAVFEAAGVFPQSFNAYDFQILYDEVIEQWRALNKESQREEIPDELSGIQLVGDIISGDTRIMENGFLLDDHFSGFAAKWGKQITDQFLSEKIRVALQYNPHKGIKWVADYTHGGHTEKDVLHINTYFHPLWSRTDTPKTFDSVHVDDLILPFFEHLFPTKESRDYALGWLYRLMRNRCQVGIVLVGARATGKTTFMDMARAIVGRRGCRNATKRLLSKEFNSELENCKLVTYEEIGISNTEQYERFKGLREDIISVEKKGKDARDVDNYSSFIITNNHLNNVYCKWDERYMSCLDVTDVDLKKVWPIERIHHLKTLLREENFHKYFPHWVEHYCKENDIKIHPQQPLITPRFWDLVETSKTKTWRKMKSLAYHQDIVTLEDIDHKKSQYVVYDSTVEKWLEEEASERRARNLEPHNLFNIEEDEDGNVQYHSNVYPGSRDDSVEVAK